MDEAQEFMKLAKGGVRWVGIAAVVIVGLMSVGFKQIDDGMAGVQFDFGHVRREPVGTGWHFFNRWVTNIEVWNVKTQEIKETSSVPSSEGLISELDVSVLYSTPKSEIVKVRTNIGADYQQKVLEPYVREAIRNVASGYEVKALFSDKGRAEIGKKILAFLHEKLDSRGIAIQDVLLRDVRLPGMFRASIESKLQAEQQALQKEFELQKAKKDAEIEIAKAQGVAKSNEIIAGSITESYLRYKWIEGLQTNNMQVVYVPTEGGLPILEANRWKVKPTKPGESFTEKN